MDFYNAYKKTVMAVIAATGVTVGTVTQILHDHQVTSAQWTILVSTWAGVWAVYQARNKVGAVERKR